MANFFITCQKQTWLFYHMPEINMTVLSHARNKHDCFITCQKQTWLFYHMPETNMTVLSHARNKHDCFITCQKQTWLFYLSYFILDYYSSLPLIRSRSIIIQWKSVLIREVGSLEGDNLVVLRNLFKPIP